MEPRPEKVAVVEEVRGKLADAEAVLVTEYRGLRVSELAELRAAMQAGGGEYKVYKNTLVRRAAAELELEIAELLSGPTALAFVRSTGGTPGDVASVAKAIADFAKGNPLLLLKGGVLGDHVLDAEGAQALASLPTAGEIYARLAGAINSGARGLAATISGVHRSLAYVLQAAIDAGTFAEAPAAAPAAEPEHATEPSRDTAPDDATEPTTTDTESEQ